MSFEHSELTVRVYYEDTDFSGRVYHASYLRFLERGRTEWLRGQGMTHHELAATTGIVFAVRSMQIDFLAPARIDDLLSVETHAATARGASMEFQQRSVSPEGRSSLQPCWWLRYAMAARRGCRARCDRPWAMPKGKGPELAREAHASGLAPAVRMRPSLARLGGPADAGPRTDASPQRVRRLRRCPWLRLKGRRPDVPKIVDWSRAGKIEIDPMITHTLTLDEIKRGLT